MPLLTSSCCCLASFNKNDDDFSVSEVSQGSVAEEQTNDPVENVTKAFTGMNFTPPRNPPASATKSTPFMMTPGSAATPSRASKKSFSSAKYQEGFTAGYRAAAGMLASQTGTKENPFHVAIDPDFPERNVGGFFVQHVEKMRHGNYERNGFHIRSLTCPSFKDWLGCIPDNPPDELFGRVIEIRRPSLPVFFKNNDHYHRKEPVCERTVDAHKATLTDIKQDVSRRFLYFWLIFPPGTVLDNRVFSKDDTILETNGLGLTVDTKGGVSR